VKSGQFFLRLTAREILQVQANTGFAYSRFTLCIICCTRVTFGANSFQEPPEEREE
jgi:hypothetical protein